MNGHAVPAGRGRDRARSRSRVERFSRAPGRDRGGPLTILHLANHCDEVGNGIMNVAVDVACKQGDLGHRIAFASAGGSYVKLLQQHRVEHFRIDQPWRHPITLLWAFFALRRLLKLLNPDVVHAHMMTGAMLAYGLRLGGHFGYRLITTVHNEWQRSAILMGVGDLVIAVSEQVSDRMRRRGIPSRKLRVVQNATLGSPRRPSEPIRENVVLKRPSVVTIAGMFQRKGIAELIEAFDRVCTEHLLEASLYIVGDGPDRHAFEALARSLNCRDRIRFVGFVRDPRPYLAQADVFVLASRNDPSPLVIPEAREAGCAIVATAVGGIPEALDYGRAGVLVPARDSKALGDSIYRLLSNQCERQLWRQRSHQNLSWLHLDRAIEETLAIYREALTGEATIAPLPKSPPTR